MFFPEERMYIWNSFLFFLLLSLFDTEEEKKKKECICISICYDGVRNSEISSSMNDNGLIN